MVYARLASRLRASGRGSPIYSVNPTSLLK
jgi:hypothetical protein